MSTDNLPGVARAFAFLLVAGGLMVGCGKEEPEVQPTQPAAETAPAPATPAPAPAAAPATAPAQNAWADAQLKQAQEAQRARDYEKAADALVALQQQRRLSEQQAAVVADQMRQFQRDLANAIASGDPKAKAAADKLRRGASGSQ